jgi:DNA (cytosine-5)-methyltransferase 1
MREWPGFESPEGVQQHITRRLPRDYVIFERMKPGDQYPKALEIARELLEEKLKDRALLGQIIECGSSGYASLVAETVPPYDPGKFKNKWWKMKADAPSRTVLAHLGKDTYSHIHYDDAQARTITIREAARLQSFSDGFIFAGGMNAAFRQIGNAVPPLLAKAVAEVVRESLAASGSHRDRAHT